MRLLPFVPLAAVVLSSCTSVKYYEFSCIDYSPRERAVFVEDPIQQQLLDFGNQIKLPHLTPGDRLQKEIELYALLTRRLGSPDYMMIGSMTGKGKDGARAGEVRLSLLKRAAKEGGDVVLLTDSGVNQWTTIHQVPGRSSTTSYGAAVFEDNTAYGAARSDTVYTPGVAYTQAHSSAWGTGVVLRHVPGIGKLRESLLGLPDEAVAQYLQFMATMSSSEITSQEFEAGLAQLVRRLRSTYKSAN